MRISKSAYSRARSFGIMIRVRYSAVLCFPPAYSLLLTPDSSCLDLGPCAVRRLQIDPQEPVGIHLHRGVLAHDHRGLPLLDDGRSLEGGAGEEPVAVIHGEGDEVPGDARIGRSLALDGVVQGLARLLGLGELQEALRQARPHLEVDELHGRVAGRFGRRASRRSGRTASGSRPCRVS